VVDDEAANLRLLQRVLGDEHTVIPALDGAQGLKVLQEQDISLIITDQRMPGLTGVELLEQSLTSRPQAIKILLTGYTDVHDLIAAINSGKIYKFIPKPWDADELKLTVLRALEAYELREKNDSLLIELQKSMTQLEEFSMGTIRALADALDAKCDYTSGHSLRVSRYALAIAKTLMLPADELKDIELAGILHDIGKIGVPESILWKPDKLSHEEQTIMSSHPVKSAQIIGELQGFDRMRLYVLHHHEFMDGSGYPNHLAGDNIPLGARIILVADAYDAMTSDRPYRKSIGHETAMVQLRKFAGRQFDSSIVELLPHVVGQNGELAQNCLPENVTGLSFSAVNSGQLAKFHQAAG
jgi:response regulator RpfG family c-di-GMP phosphodiesterase